MVPIEKKKVARAPRTSSKDAKSLKPLALKQLADALKEGDISVSELLRILALPETESAPAFTLPDGWKLYHEE